MILRVPITDTRIMLLVSCTNNLNIPLIPYSTNLLDLWSAPNLIIISILRRLTWSLWDDPSLSAYWLVQKRAKGDWVLHLFSLIEGSIVGTLFCCNFRDDDNPKARKSTHLASMLNCTQQLLPPTFWICIVRAFVNAKGGTCNFCIPIRINLEDHH